MGIAQFITRLLQGGNYARRVEKVASGRCGHERRILDSIPSVREHAVSDIRGIGVLARACTAERGGNTGEMPSDPIRRESLALIAAAKRTGCFVTAQDVPGTRYTIRSGESEVRMSQKEQVYYKIKNPFAKSHLKKHPPEYALFEHVIHNILFPDCRLDFLGVAEDCREARLVFRQDAVRADTRPDDGQIAEHLRRLGLLPDDRYSFGNEWIFVTDVGQDSDNVLLDDDGRLRFIDPILGFKQPLLDKLSDISTLEHEIDNLIYGILSLHEA